MNYKTFRGGALIKPITEELGIASFNPRCDKVDKANIMLKIPEKEIILNQGSFNSCVAHSLVMCESLLQYKKTNKWIDFDPYMIYGTVNTNQYSGPGMYPVDGINNCIKEGYYFRRDFGLEGEKPSITNIVSIFKKNHPELVKQALNYNLSSKAVVYNWRNVKSSLEMGLPVTATWALYDSFFTKTGDDGIVKIPNTYSENFLGNHQMTIVGIRDDNKYIVVNSYGKEMGFKGLYYIPFDYNFIQAFSVADDIMPTLYKASKIELIVGSDTVIIDGQAKNVSIAPMIINDRTYVPVRLVSEALGASVEWDGINRVVTIRSEEAEIKLTIDKKWYTIDGHKHEMDVAPIIVNDYTLLPIRFISEALNCDVSWNQEQQKVTIKCL